MPDGISAWSSSTSSVEATINAANFARKSEGGGRYEGNEECLQQKRVNCERADRDAPCNQTLAETSHPQSLYGGRYRGLVHRSKENRNMKRWSE
jgi:hypothetical protein